MGKEIDYPTAADSSTAAMQPSEWDLMSWEERDATFTFRFVLVFVAALEAFAHGSNDTGNATGSFSAVYQTWSEGLNTCGKAQTPVWIMAAAGAVVFIGVAAFGFKHVKWWLFGTIALTWVLTLPFAGLIGAALTAGIRVGIRR